MGTVVLGTTGQVLESIASPIKRADAAVTCERGPGSRPVVEGSRRRGSPSDDNGDSFFDVGCPSYTGTLALVQYMRNMAGVITPDQIVSNQVSSICYAYAIRYFATSPLSRAEIGDDVEIHQTLSQSLPFLVDRKSKIAHSNLSSVVTDVWSRLQHVCSISSS